MSDEQRVRTMCGWIGVEISRSRVRTPGKTGYGLWRVRGSVSHRTRAELDGLVDGAVTADGVAERGPWTAYAFTMDQIYGRVMWAIQGGTPNRPGDLVMHGWDGCRRHDVAVPTRWTSAYRGRRDLGMSVPAEIRPEVAHRVSALAALVDAGLIEMKHEPWCSCKGTSRIMAGCLDLTMGDESARTSIRQRQREMNAEFQAEHLERRAHGKAAYHAAKLARMHSPGTSET